MLMPSISRYMTRQPWTIGREAKISQADELMREHHIRHLPVLDAGKLIGILSQRDVYLFNRIISLDSEDTVGDAMTVDVYAAGSDDPVDTVVENMAEHKYGSAVVVDKRGQVEGIFTTVDGMQVFAEVLRRVTA